MRLSYVGVLVFICVSCCPFWEQGQDDGLLLGKEQCAPRGSNVPERITIKTNVSEKITIKIICINGRGDIFILDNVDRNMSLQDIEKKMGNFKDPAVSNNGVKYNDVFPKEYWTDLYLDGEGIYKEDLLKPVSAWMKPGSNTLTLELRGKIVF